MRVLQTFAVGVAASLALTAGVLVVQQSASAAVGDVFNNPQPQSLYAERPAPGSTACSYVVHVVASPKASAEADGVLAREWDETHQRPCADLRNFILGGHVLDDGQRPPQWPQTLPRVP